MENSLLLDALTTATIKSGIRLNAKECFSLFLYYGCNGIDENGVYDSETIKMWNYLKKPLIIMEKEIFPLVDRLLKTYSDPHRHRLCKNDVKVLQSLTQIYLDRHPVKGKANDRWSEVMKKLEALLKDKCPVQMLVLIKDYLDRTYIRQSLKSIRVLVFFNVLRDKIFAAEAKRQKQHYLIENLDLMKPYEQREAIEMIINA